MKQELYQLLRDAYYGDGQFYKGKGLRRHPREQELNYRDRQALAYYLNYTGPIVDASVNPVYRDSIRREHNDTERFTAFLDDCDRKGTDYQDFLKRTAKWAKLYGVAYVLVNNNNSVGETLADSVQGHKFPFLSLILPENITSWEHDDWGRLTRLEWTTQEDAGDGQKREVHQMWTNTEWVVTADNKVLTRGQHNLGVVPIVKWCGRSTDATEMIPTSEFISVAQANYFLYQVCSWHTQILRDQAFSILCMPDTSEGDITVGTNNVLAYDPMATHPPSFISPDAGPASMLTEQMDRIIQEMYRMCGMESVVGIQSNKSGVAKQWDFEKTNQKLADFAIQCEQAELEIIKLYELWTKENLDYYCEYPRDFKINDVADSLAEAQSALDLGLGGSTFRTEVGRKVLDAYMPNMDGEVYDAIIDEFAQEGEEKLMSETYGHMNEADEDRTNNTGI